MTESTSSDVASKNRSRWTDALIIASILAVGVVVAGLLQPPEEPELTTAPVSPTPEQVDAPEYVRVTEPVDPSAAIPGCDVVQDPGEAEFSMTSSIGGQPSYDNPKFPWFGAAKATAMSDAVLALLPADAELEFASPRDSLVFGPIIDFDESDPQSSGSTDAWGSLVRGNARGSVHVGVQQAADSAPPCVAGSVDERKTLPDGTIVDLLDTWEEVDGVRSLMRSASAYTLDGSVIHVSADDRLSNENSTSNSGLIPMTVDELESIAVEPALRVSASVPDGVELRPAQQCAVYTETAGPDITREQAQRLNDALAGVDLGGLVFDRPLNTLQLSGFGKDSVCTSVSVAGNETTFGITISSGQELPVEGAGPIDPYSGEQNTFRTLGDGTVVETAILDYAALSGPDASEQRTSNSVTVTHPGGTRVSTSSSARVPATPVRLDLLESIALTQGLEIS